MEKRIFDKHRKNFGNYKFRKIKPSKYDYNNPEEKYYWRDFIEEIEKLARNKAKETKIKQWDLSTTLPYSLYKRVAKIIPIKPFEDDFYEDDFELNEELDTNEINRDHDIFNESTLSEILEQEKEYKTVQLTIEHQPKIQREQDKISNWFSDFVAKRRKERVRWKSKLYKMEKSLLEKPLFEQAEDVMDTAAQNFSDWLNTLGSDENTNVNKNMIKQLFSMGIEEATATAIQIAPKQVRAIPHEVATKLNIPKMSLELKVDRHLKKLEKQYPEKVKLDHISSDELRNKLKNVNKPKKIDPKEKISWKQKTKENILKKQAAMDLKPKTIAFGRTLPIEMRKWIPSDIDQPLQPQFPEELLTAETLFKGIGHLRSTKALIDHYLQNDKLDRPKYLVDIGAFKPTIKRQSKEHIPLYERLIK